MLEVSNNIRTLISQVGKRKKSFIKSLERRFKETIGLFIKRIQRIQLSGRAGSNPGKYLYKRSGKLFDSFSGTVKVSDKSFNIRTSIESNSPYIQYHQNGTSRLPKRLFISEDWKKVGREVLTSDVRQALKEFTRK